jgi:radical SAM protein with 4Fe4S-binding SPASM domain
MIELQTPSLVEWLVTDRCNLRCRHCSTWRAGEQDEFTTAEACALADRIAALRVFTVILSGGEPFIRDDVAEICGRLSSQGVSVLIPTNGCLVTPEAAARLVAAKPSSVQVSLDGPDAATHDAFRGVAGAFDGALRAVAALQDAGLAAVGVSTTVSALNVDKIPAIIDLAIARGVRALNLRLCMPCGRARQDYAAMVLTPRRYRRLLEDFVRWREELRGRIDLATVEPLLCLVDPELSRAGADFEGDDFSGCGAGKTGCCVWPNGDVSPCAYTDQFAGNVRRDDLGEIWRTSPVFRPYRRYADLVQGVCASCEHKRICAAGCKSRTYGLYGTVSRPDPMCWLAADHERDAAAGEGGGDA